MAMRRLLKERKDLMENPVEGIQAAPVSDTDMFNWRGSVVGPEGSPYEGGNFFLDIVFPAEYPFKPPKVTFSTKIFHPNVNDNGGVCLDTLKDNWTPSLTIGKVLMTVQQLMMDPNADSALVPEIGTMIRENPEAFRTKAKEWTKQYAT